MESTRLSDYFLHEDTRIACAVSCVASLSIYTIVLYILLVAGGQNLSLEIPALVKNSSSLAAKAVGSAQNKPVVFMTLENSVVKQQEQLSDKNTQRRQNTQASSVPVPVLVRVPQSIKEALWHYKLFTKKNMIKKEIEKSTGSKRVHQKMATLKADYKQQESADKKLHVSSVVADTVRKSDAGKEKKKSAQKRAKTAHKNKEKKEAKKPEKVSKKQEKSKQQESANNVLLKEKKRELLQSKEIISGAQKAPEKKAPDQKTEQETAREATILVPSKQMIKQSEHVRLEKTKQEPVIHADTVISADICSQTAVSNKHDTNQGKMAPATAVPANKCSQKNDQKPAILNNTVIRAAAVVVSSAPIVVPVLEKESSLIVPEGAVIVAGGPLMKEPVCTEHSLGTGGEVASTGDQDSGEYRSGHELDHELGDRSGDEEVMVRIDYEKNGMNDTVPYYFSPERAHLVYKKVVQGFTNTVRVAGFDQLPPVVIQVALSHQGEVTARVLSSSGSRAKDAHCRRVAAKRADYPHEVYGRVITLTFK